MQIVPSGRAHIIPSHATFAALTRHLLVLPGALIEELKTVLSRDQRLQHSTQYDAARRTRASFSCPPRFVLILS